MSKAIDALIRGLVESSLAGDRSPRSRGKIGQYPVPTDMKAESKKGEDLGFGFNEEGFPLQDKYEFQGMPVAVENKKGSTRKWYDKDGKEKGSTKMHADYGYVEGTKGADGEDVDVYIGDDDQAVMVYVVHQNKAPDFDVYDEDKVMIGFSSEEDARKLYLKQYNDPKFYGGMSSMPVEKFKEKLSAVAGKKITNEIARRVIQSLGEDKGSASFDLDAAFTSDAGTHPDIVPGGVKQVEEPADEAIGRNLIKNFRDLMAKKRGLVIPAQPPMLGVGTKGTTFDIGGGKVLKVTVDSEEAVAANKVKELGQLKHVYRVFDVFRFRDTPYYAVVQEKLSPMPGLPKAGQSQFGDDVTGQAADFNDALRILNFWPCVNGATSWQEVRQRVIDYSRGRASKMEQASAKSYLQKVNEKWNFILSFGVKEMFEELRGAGIDFRDYHAGNIMHRPNGDWVVIDLGYSKIAGGKKPDVLEKKKKLKEGNVESVGVTVGRFQPFHKGHADIVRRLASKHTKVIVFVAGLKKDKLNPFSFETRVELMKLSLPDIESKLEVYKAEDESGKQTGYIPALVDRVIVDKNSTVEQGVSINVAVGPDRAAEVKKMVDHAFAEKESGKSKLQAFDPTICAVEEIPELKNDGDSERVSGTRVRDALVKGDKEAVKQMLDPHVATEETEFDAIYDSLRSELGVSESVIREDLASAGGTAALMRAAGMSANLLKLRLGADIEKAKVLGNGQKGVALDIGGGKVLKLTTDEKEANAAHSLEGKPTNKIARIFKVFRLKDKAQNEDVYIIEQEKVEPISQEEGREFDAAMKQIGDAEDANDVDGPLTAIATGDIERMYKFMRVFWAKEIREEMQYPIGSAQNPRKEMKLASVIQQREEMLKKTLDKFKVPEMMEELKSLGIQFADYHAGNLGKRGGDYVVFDLGQSKVDGASPPPMLEQIMSAVMERLGVPGSPTDYAGTNARVSSGYFSSGNLEEPDKEGDEASRVDPESSRDKLQPPTLPPKFEGRTSKR